VSDDVERLHEETARLRRLAEERETQLRYASEVRDRAMGLLAEFVAGWTDIYVAPPPAENAEQAQAPYRRMSLAHQNAERLLARERDDIPTSPRPHR
jgi:hypothetical protein